MNVGELRKIPNKYPSDLPIVLASDSEGNSFSLLFHLETDNIGYLVNSDAAGNSTDKVSILYPTR